MSEIVIVSGVRTAIGSFGGSLKDVPVVKLGALVIKEALKRAGLRPKTGSKLLGYAPQPLKDAGIVDLEKKYQDWDSSLKEVQVDEVIMGNVLSAGQGQNPGRQATIQAGLPKETNSFTVNKLCASGLKAIALGAQAIMTGDAEIIVAGGMENMSAVPYAMPRARWGYRMDLNGVGDVLDLMVWDGLYEIFYGYHMGMTAENVAAKYGITRLDQDEIGLLSHQTGQGCDYTGYFQAGNSACSHTAKERRSHRFRYRRAAHGHIAGKDGEIAHHIQKRRHGHRRQCFRCKRCRGCSSAYEQRKST